MNTYTQKEIDKEVKRGEKRLLFSAKRIDKELLEALDKVEQIKAEKELNMLALAVVKKEIKIK